MANWKKVIVSGSNISELVNDANYLTSAGGIDTASYVEAAFNKISASDATITMTDMGGNPASVTVDNVGSADTATSASHAVVADSADSVAGANVSGTVASATSASYASNASTADSAADADSLSGVTLLAAELNQVANINAVTISNTQWGYLGAADQGVASTDDVTFNTVAATTFTGDLTGEASSAISASHAVVADSADSVAFANVTGLTTFSSSIESRVDTLESSDFQFNLGVQAEGGTADTIADGENINFTSDGNLTITNPANNEIRISLDSAISADVTGNLTGTADSATSASHAVVADSADSVAGANVTGTVASATSASYASNASTADSAADADSLAGVTLLAAELNQIQNINAVTISNTQWGYLGDLNQALTSTSNVNFGTIGGSTLTLSGDVSVNSTAFTVDASTGNSTVGNDFTVGNDLTVSGRTTMTGLVNMSNNLVVSGDLTVNGTTTTLNTSNLDIEDRFIFLNEGSGSVAPVGEGGIIVEHNSAGSGSAFYYDGNSGRWSTAFDIAKDATSVTPTGFMAQVFEGSTTAANIAGYQGVGNFAINTAGDIYIFA